MVTIVLNDSWLSSKGLGTRNTEVQGKQIAKKIWITNITQIGLST